MLDQPQAVDVILQLVEYCLLLHTPVALFHLCPLHQVLATQHVQVRSMLKLLSPLHRPSLSPTYSRSTTPNPCWSHSPFAQGCSSQFHSGSPSPNCSRSGSPVPRSHSSLNARNTSSPTRLCVRMSKTLSWPSLSVFPLLAVPLMTALLTHSAMVSPFQVRIAVTPLLHNRYNLREQKLVMLAFSWFITKGVCYGT